MISVSTATSWDVIDACRARKPIFNSDHDLVEVTLRGLTDYGAMALKDDYGNIGAIIGVVPFNSGAFQVWAVTTVHMDKHPLAYARKIRKLIDINAKGFNAHRAELTVKVGYPEAEKWAEFLGFQREGLLRQYNSDKTDSILFGRIW